MKKAVLVVSLFAFASNAVADPDAEMIKTRRSEAKAKLTTPFGAEYTSASSDTLQAVGQAVLKKAVRAGWKELESKLADLAGCDQTPKTLPKTCDVLGQARIEDLIASPKILLDAFVADMVPKLTAAADKLPTEIKAAAVGAAAAWLAFGPDAAPLNLKPWMMKQLNDHADDVQCPPDEAAAVAWLLAECYAHGSSPSTAVAIANCNFDERLKSCSFSATAKDEVRSVAELVASTLKAIEDNAKTVPDLVIQSFFEWAKLADTADKTVLDGLEQTFLGLADHDWTRTVVGIGHIAMTTNAAKCDEDKHKCNIGMKLVRIMGSVGQFAETYTAAGKSADPTAAREKVIEDLITSLVDRSERDHGFVFSLGGALGMFGGQRFDASNSQWSQPVRLTLGLGVQSYRSGKGGFHASLDAFDLGQYVTYSAGSLDVAPPDTKSAFILGGTIGGWLCNRETPIFIAAHGAASPFVRTTAGKMTYEAGLLVGIYVPLLDFN